MIRHFVMAITGPRPTKAMSGRAAIAERKLMDCWRNLAKQPPDATASHHHKPSSQCDCSRNRQNYCCERKDVHKVPLKCEKHTSLRLGRQVSKTRVLHQRCKCPATERPQLPTPTLLVQG